MLFDDKTKERIERTAAALGVDPGELAAGLAAVQSRRDEAGFAGYLRPDRRQERPTPPNPNHDNLSHEIRLHPAQACDPAPGLEGVVKIWPMVLLAAIKSNKGGAARLWFIARALDRQGAGKISRADLWGALAGLKIGGRQRRRWFGQALDLGLLRQDGDLYFYASLANGALWLGCPDIGRPATLPASSLARSGWRAAVWSAYLATLKGPISQDTKFKLTGIDPRTQRNYQSQEPGHARRNYAKTNLSGDHAGGLREFGRSSAFVGEDDRIYYRLPDQRIVPLFVAQPAPKGRSRKAQKQINFSSTLGRDPGFVLRLFHERHESVKAALRRLSHEDIPPWDAPAELFEKHFTGQNSNLWRVVNV